MLIFEVVVKLLQHKHTLSNSPASSDGSSQVPSFSSNVPSFVTLARKKMPSPSVPSFKRTSEDVCV